MKKNVRNVVLASLGFVTLLTSAIALNAQAVARAASSGAPDKPAPTSQVTGNGASGKALYYSYGCYACHGYNGETGYRAFVGNWGHLANEQEFVTFLRGRANIAPVIPSDRMPNFSEAVMSDKQAKDIYAFIRTFKSSAPPLKDIPTLNAILDQAKREKN
jgi:mono/diheme cytochrome c family protein